MKIPRLEALRKRRELEKQLKERASLAREKAEQIAKHRETVLLSRDDHPEAWKFIEEMFPRLSTVISQTKVYANKNTYFCEKVGIPPNAGGLFIIKASAIVLCHSKCPDDIVIVHELLHYCSQLMGSRFRNEGFEEDFAYQTSIPYIAQRGYSEDWIAEKYLLPYYWSREQEALLRKKRAAKGKPPPKLTLSEKYKAKDLALEKCKSIVHRKLHGKMDDQGDDEDDICRFSFM